MTGVGPGAAERVGPGAAELVGQARAGSTRAVARLISLVEDPAGDHAGVAALLVPLTGNARVVGLTGAPGVGKSTSTAALVAALRARGERVGVLAIDPSSPYSGGALLGDRIRMGEHAGDPGVFIRSMATRGHLGGLSAAVPQAVRILDAAGFDTVIIETVGVGQSEVDIAALADSTIVLLAPGMGDGIQAAKAGLLEIGDVFVVNKAERDGAQTTARELRHMITIGSRDAAQWTPPVVLTVASRGEGIAEVAAALDAHADWQRTTGERERRRHTRTVDEITAIALGELRRRIVGADAAATAVLAGTTDPHTAAAGIVAAVTGGWPAGAAVTGGRPAAPGGQPVCAPKSK